MVYLSIRIHFIPVAHASGLLDYRLMNSDRRIGSDTYLGGRSIGST